MIHLPRRINVLASTAAAVAVLFLSGTPAHASHVGEALNTDVQFVASNNQLVNALAQWDKMPASVREARVAHLATLAAQRQEHMIALLQKNPAVAAARMMPKEMRDRLPAQAAAYVEREVSAQGTVFASVADNFAQGTTKTQFKFQSNAGGAAQDIYLADATATERDMLKWAGKKLSLNAIRIGDHLALLDKKQVQVEAAGSTTTSSGDVVATTTAVSGVQKTLSILVNFNDKPLACTAADVNNRLFGSTGATVNNNYRESSRGMVGFSGQVVGPFTINYNSTGTCDYSGWGAAAEAAARAAGVDPSQFARVNYVVPPGTCGWTGLAYMPGRQSWVASCGSTGVYSHELGHNISLHHAGTPTSEYGDASDPMGGAQMVDHNAANRTMAGWMPAGTVADVGSGGSYSVTTVSNTTSVGVPQVLRLVKLDTHEYYYVSVRAAMGLDASLSSAFLNTVSVHRASGTLPAKTYLMQQLAAGQSFTDATNGITITNQGVAGGVATLAVTMAGPVCSRAAPAVSFSPASQSGGPGVAKAYTLTLVNKNSAACGTSTFALSQLLPAGFGGSLSTSSLAVGAGASGSATWTVTSGAASLDGVYGLDASARDTATGGLITTAHGSYTVYRDSTAPSLTITSPAATTASVTYSARTNLTIAASATDTSGVQAVEFYGDGALLARDTSAPYSASWNLRKAGKGVHTIKARAIDNAGNVTERSVSITVN